MVKIVRNVGGVPGLDVALDAFSEDVERRLFESRTLFVRSPAQGATNFGTDRNGHVSGPQTWDQDVWKTLNLVGDTFPEHYVPPDYCLALSYPNGAQFKDHFDSRYRWGECIVGVCLGQAVVMYYVQQKGPTLDEWQQVEGLNVKVSTQKSGKVCVEVTLPRRTIYRMNGPARLDWKHGIRMQTEARLKSFPPPPTWNPWNMRRSLTLRCQKAYSDAYLQHLLKLHPNDAHLQARWKQQQPLRPQNDYGGNRLNNAELALERQRGQGILQRMLHSPYRNLRWGPDDTYQSFASTQGNRLGGEQGLSQMMANVAGAQEDADLQAAIRASLAGQEQQPEQQQSASPSSFAGGGNRLGGDSDTEQESELQAALRLSLGESPSSHGGTAGDPIALDDDDNNDENADSTKSATNGGGKREASDKEESEESKRKRLRLARLRRFEISTAI